MDQQWIALDGWIGTVITAELGGIASDVDAVLLVRRVAPSAVVVAVTTE